LERDLLILSNKAKYIQDLLSDTIDLRKKKKQEIIDMLQDNEYDVIDNDEDFTYLVKMPMDSVSQENVEKLLKEHLTKQDELDRIKSTTIQQMWLSELEILEHEYQEYQKEREYAQIGDIKVSKKKTVTKIAGGAKKIVKKSSINLEISEEIEIQPKNKQVTKKLVKKTS
jgi:DNA topoisomerase-2